MLEEDIEQLLESFKKAEYRDIDAPFDENYDPWILEPLVPAESITILDGLGGSGKSWFALDLSYSITLGQTFLGKFPVKKKGPVLYLTAEETPQIFLSRLRAIRTHYPKSENFIWISMLHKEIVKAGISSYLCGRKKGEQITTPTAELLEIRISAIKPVLVVIDSLINFYGLNENDSDDAIFFYDVIKTLAMKYETAFLLLHHQNKEGMRAQADDVISFRGSGVLREQARSRIINKNVNLGDGMFAKKIILEKSNYYSKLRNEIPEKGLYLKFEGGKHEYDEKYHNWAMSKEAEKSEKKDGKKGKEKNKKGQEEIEDYEIPF